MQARIRIRGLEENKLRLRGYRERSKNFIRGISPDVILYLRRNINQFFELETDPDGIRWHHLRPEYVQDKIEAGFDPRILHRTLRLRRSLTQRTPDSIITVRDLLLKFGTRVDYAYKHEIGLGVHIRHFMPRGDQIVHFIRNRSREYIFGLGRVAVLSDPNSTLLGGFNSPSTLNNTP